MPHIPFKGLWNLNLCLLLLLSCKPKSESTGELKEAIGYKQASWDLFGIFSQKIQSQLWAIPRTLLNEPGSTAPFIDGKEQGHLCFYRLDLPPQEEVASILVNDEPVQRRNLHYLCSNETRSLNRSTITMNTLQNMVADLEKGTEKASALRNGFNAMFQTGCFFALGAIGGKLACSAINGAVSNYFLVSNLKTRSQISTMVDLSTGGKNLRVKAKEAGGILNSLDFSTIEILNKFAQKADAQPKDISRTDTAATCPAPKNLHFCKSYLKLGYKTYEKNKSSIRSSCKNLGQNRAVFRFEIKEPLGLNIMNYPWSHVEIGIFNEASGQREWNQEVTVDDAQAFLKKLKKDEEKEEGERAQQTGTRPRTVRIRTHFAYEWIPQLPSSGVKKIKYRVHFKSNQNDSKVVDSWEQSIWIRGKNKSCLEPSISE